MAGSRMPDTVSPMLCSLTKELPESSDYIYEMKWDGYRIVAKVENEELVMRSRGGLDCTRKYPLIAEALRDLHHDLVIDGEVVVFNDEGKPDFESLQLYNSKRTPIRYCVFDLLYLDGNNLMELPLYQRKELLARLTKDNDIFLFSESFEDGKALYSKVLEENLEGVIAKKKDSIYLPGSKGMDWQIIPARKRREFGKNSDDSTAELRKYHEKRSFDITSEPTGGYSDREELSFVIQKHDASHLHYDFRLEIRGVLKSWAVPKGPSMNPRDHRLAMEVEDHPYDYKDFEGIIPAGQYGGGTVLVWDNGTYEPAEQIQGKAQQEKWLLANYHKNKLSIIMHGKKLKGKFTLVKTFGKGENAWLLTKAQDEEALDSDITKNDQSVKSGFTILEVAMDSQSKTWHSNRSTGSQESSDINKEEAELEAELAGPEVLNSSGPADDDEDLKEPDLKYNVVGDLFPQSQNKRSVRSKISEESNWSKIFEEKVKSEGSIPVEGQKIQLTNIEKKLWKETNKANLIAYYNNISDYILPYLKDRPLSLHIKNLNANAPGFYIKDMEGFQPDFLDIYSTSRKHKVKGKADIIDYAVCNNLPSLLWLINLGNIDLNPWNSRVNNPSEPDYIAIDLDPSDEDFKKVIKTALAAKEYFKELNLITFVKTSGKTGIHIFIPCQGFTYQHTRKLAEFICGNIHKRIPRITTTELSINKRGNKLFGDFSQNDEADTLAAAYSVRPGRQPNVSAPIAWDELNLKLKLSDFNIINIPARLLEKGDLWKELYDDQIKARNSTVLKTML